MAPEPNSTEARLADVGREQLERSLAELSDLIEDPAAGIHGPGSKNWEIDREAILFLGGGRAALLQLAHPFVGHGVDDHSATRQDPQGRFIRTFENVWAMVFGPLDEALASARRVHAVHSRVNGVIDEDVGRFTAGTPYSAANAEALLWVYATLVDSALLVYQLMVRPLADAEKETYYQGSKRFTYLFGIPQDIVPAKWRDFEGYLERMYSSGTIGVGSRAREISRFLLRPPHPLLAPLAAWYRAVTARLLPPAIRQQFGLSYGPMAKLVAAVSIAMLRRVLGAMPGRLRQLPVYRQALARLS